MQTSTVTLKDIAGVANSAYNNSSLNLGGAWQTIPTNSLSPGLKAAMTAYGYAGVAAVNLDTGEVIIGNRGTVGNVGNVTSDAQIALGLTQQAQAVANQFATEAIQQAGNRLQASNLPITAVYTTGHSLGGAESQGQTAMLSSLIASGQILDTAVHVTNVSFDAPGIGSLATTGDDMYYTSYNISGRGDLIHYAGGDNLAGTQNVTAQYGPELWATAGLLGAGATLAIASRGILTSSLVAGGLWNTYESHKVTLLDVGITSSALASTTLSDLSDLNSTEFGNLLSISQTDFNALSQQQKDAWLAKTPSTSDPLVYNDFGYDQYGRDVNGFDIYGRDKSGNLDPAIRTSSDTTAHLATFSDGTIVNVRINNDGSYVQSVYSPGDGMVTSQVDSDGVTTEMSNVGLDGAVSDSVLNPDGSLTTTSQTTQNDGSTLTLSRTLNPDGSVKGTTTSLTASDGSVSSSVTDADGGITTTKHFADGSKESEVVFPDGSSVKTATDRYGTELTTSTDVNGVITVVANDTPGNVNFSTVNSKGETVDVWSRVKPVLGVDQAQGYLKTALNGDFVEIFTAHQTGNTYDGQQLWDYVPNTQYESRFNYYLDFSYKHERSGNQESWHLEEYVSGELVYVVNIVKINNVFTYAVIDTHGEPAWTFNLIAPNGLLDWPHYDYSTMGERDMGVPLNFSRIVDWSNEFAHGGGGGPGPDWSLPGNLVTEASTTIGDTVTNVLVTGHENVSIVGNSKDNWISANSGNDTLTGGAGHDTLVGGAGQDVYTALAADGTDYTIIDGKGGSEFIVVAGNGKASIGQGMAIDKLVFSSGMTISDVTARMTVDASGTNIVELKTSSGGTIEVAFNHQTGNLRQIEFSDGTTTTLSKLLLRSDPATASVLSTVGGALDNGVVEMTLSGNAPLWAVGNALDNIIRANSGDDVLIGGRGNDTLIAGSGNDTLVGGRQLVRHDVTTYHIDQGNGTTTILYSGHFDVLEFGAGIRPEDVTASVARVEDTAPIIHIWIGDSQHVMLEAGGYEMLNQVKFADGTTMSILDIQHNTPGSVASIYSVPEGVTEYHVAERGDVAVTANSSDIAIFANTGYDTLIGGVGEDTLVGGGGHMVFVAGKGKTTFVVDPDDRSDTFQVALGSGDVVIKHASADSAHDSILQLGEGLKREHVKATALIGGAGGNAIQLEFSNGQTITYEDNDGRALPKWVQFDGDSFSAPVSISALLAENPDGHISASSGTSGSAGWGILHYTLTGNTDLVVTGNGFDETIIGNAGNDTLIGGSGHDTLVAGTGTTYMSYGANNTVGTTYQINSDSGNVRIDANYNDVLQFGAGISIDQITAKINMTSGSPSSMTLVMASGAVVVVNVADGMSLQDVRLADGSSVSMFDLINHVGSSTISSSVDTALPAGEHVLVLTGINAVTGTGNGEHHIIVANDAGDTLVAGAGSATLIGGAGNDHFIVNNTADVVIDQYTDDDQIMTAVDYKLPEGINTLVGTGTDHLTLTGNDGYNFLQANDAGNVLIGSGFATLSSGFGTAADTLVGSSYTTTFLIHNSNTVVVAKEAASNSVVTSVDYTLPEHVHVMSTDGTGGLTLQGNDDDSFLSTVGSNDTLTGGVGTTVLEDMGESTTLIGGDGRVAMIAAGNTGTTILVGDGAAFIAGGTGNDMITLGASSSVVAYGAGGAHDVIVAGSASGNILSFDAGRSVADLGLSRSSADLILTFDSESSITLKDWYLGAGSQEFAKLQFVSADSDASGGEGDFGGRVEVYDFASIVAAFNAKLAQDPGTTTWTAADGWHAALLEHNDHAAYGGDLAYYLGLNGNLTGMDYTSAVASLIDADFGTHLQQLHQADQLYWLGSAPII